MTRKLANSLIFLAAIACFGCLEGPAGPQGEPGQPGADGKDATSDWRVKYVHYDDIEPYLSEFWTVQIPDLTANSAIQVYAGYILNFQNGTKTDYWEPIAFTHSNKSITMRNLDETTNQMTTSYDWQVKIVYLPIP